MKTAIKTLAQLLLGRRRFFALQQRLRWRSSSFSEIDLIEEYFAGRAAPGFMLDVGARHGESLMFYQCRRWHVLAFEPDPANRTVLETRIDPAYVEILPMAVSNHEAQAVPFFASPESDGVSSLSAFLKTHREVTQVPLTTLSAVLATRPAIQSITYLKVDTEGHDFFVLEGFPWDRYLPEVVVCEFDDQKTVPLGYTWNNMGRYLLSKGYRVFASEWAPITRYGAKHTWVRWNEYPCQLKTPHGWGNFVAVRPSADLSRIGNYLKRITTHSAH